MDKLKLLIFVLLSAMIIISCHTQTHTDCGCESNYAWVKKTFEENDAGFQYVLNRKGEKAYQVHNKAIEERIKSAKTLSSCRDIIADWLTFFRKKDQHLRISLSVPSGTVENDNVPLIMKNHYPDRETFEVDTVEFKNYLQQKQNIDFEGIWDYGIFEIGIKRDNNNYIGFILKSKTDKWTEGQVKFKIFPESAVYYTDNHNARNEHFILIGKNIVHLENQNDGMLRLFPRYEDRYSQSVVNNHPYCEKVNANTVYLRIPSFAYQLNNTINSVVSANEELITKNENLIIDLRFNGGGLDNCWQSIMPFISSNPVLAKNCYYLSTRLNNKQAKQFLDESRLKKLNGNLGKFVLLSDEEYTTVDYGKFEYPQKVAILVNHTCASSTEQFLLYAQQSEKVKIFGTNTMGSLDFSNVNIVESPCKEFLLFYATSKAVDIDKCPIDGIGIQPDYNLNDIPDYKWVDYVSKILNDNSE